MDQSAGQSFPTGAIPVQVVYPESSNLKYSRKRATILGASQIGSGLVCIIFKIILLSICGTDYRCRSAAVTGYGIWTGTLFVATGIVGCCSGRSPPRRNLITAFMVMSIVSASITIWPIVLGIGDSMEMSFRCWSTSVSTSEICSIITASSALIAVFSFIETILAIISSVVCCKAICDCCNDRSFAPKYAYYDTKTQQFIFSSGIPGVPLEQSQSLNPNTGVDRTNFDYQHL